MATEMDNLIELVAKQLVDHPDDVRVDKQGSDGPTDRYDIAVNGGDLGQVIGRQGRTARAIRAVVRAAAAKQGRRAQVEILD